MSGAYTQGLDLRKRKCNESESTSSGQKDGEIFSADDRRSSTCKRRRVSPTDAEVIPKFRPEESSSNVVGWLHKIDQLGDIYGWSSTDRQFIMQLRLRGAARDWYDDLEDYDLSWDQWKRALHVAFPRSTDYVDRLPTIRLGKMLSKTKKDTEGMTKYYHEKLSLLKKCDINGEDAISCIIRGLPVELRANAKAFICDTPEELYYGYLSSLVNYKRIDSTNSTIPKLTWRRGDSSSSAPQLLPKICYVCRRPGHEARDCRSQQCCDTCKRAGHKYEFYVLVLNWNFAAAGTKDFCWQFGGERGEPWVSACTGWPSVTDYIQHHLCRGPDMPRLRNSIASSSNIAHSLYSDRIIYDYICC